MTHIINSNYGKTANFAHIKFNIDIMNPLSRHPHICLLFSVLFLAMSMPSKAKVIMPSFFSDHMVLQRDQPIPLWGTAVPNETITIKFKDYEETIMADSDGQWRVSIPKQKAGGPYLLHVNNLIIRDIYVGDVFLCSGQSNMELTVKRVMSKYQNEIESYENHIIRYSKTTYAYDFVSPRHDSGNIWKICNQENICDYSALCYFFAKELQKEKGVAIGIINSSWGGTPIVAWSTKKSLKKIPSIKKSMEAELYTNPNYPDSIKEIEQISINQWYELQREKDIVSSLESDKLDNLEWKSVDIFSEKWSGNDGDIKNGVYYFRNNITIPDSLSESDAILHVGTMKDADDTYLNRIHVGKTSYQYPPRIYSVPAGILKGGVNEIIIRLLSCQGRPLFIEGKPYQLEIGTNIFTLGADWQMFHSCTMPPQPQSTSFQNYPTGLYNAMIHPFKNFAIKGVIWYQGESDCGLTASLNYERHLTSLISDWRKQWSRPDLPFVIVQLANFQKRSEQPMESGIANIREAQRKVCQMDKKVGLATAIDLGESNDIHPLNKKDLAHRCVLQFEKIAYGKNIIAEGPIPIRAKYSNRKEITIEFSREGGNLKENDDITGISVASADGKYQYVKAYSSDNSIIIPWDCSERPIHVKYAWQNNPPSTIYNTLGLPASSFYLKIDN